MANRAASSPGPRPWARVVAAVSLAYGGFHLWTAATGLWPPFAQRGIHLAGALFLALVLWDRRGGHREGPPGWLDGALLAAGLGLAAWMAGALAPEAVLQRGLFGLAPGEDWAGWLLILLVLEGTRRTVGWPVVLVAVAFLLYGLAGPWLPEVVAHKGYGPGRLAAYLVWTTEGVFGVPLAVSSTFVMVFIIFGALLQRLGGGEYFLALSLAASGRRGAGPALTAVVASALMGSISGSAVSNVVTTGSVTIPLMIRRGYRPAFAAAVEAAASTGGQIMPPVMGAAAFVLAEMAGLPYARVALAAAAPALGYFWCLGLMVAGETGLRGLGRVTPEAGEGGRPSLAQGAHLLLPLALLVWLLMGLGLSPLGAGFWATVALAAVGVAEGLLRRRRAPWREMTEALILAGRLAAPVALACASAGLVIGVVSLTGLGVRFTQLLVTLSGGQLWLALVLMMLACIVLGMGLPTTAAYVITAVLGVPALTGLGVEPLAAHLFIFYFAIISFITPPVAIAAFAAAGLAGCRAMSAGGRAFLLGGAGYLVPYYLIYHPALLGGAGWLAWGRECLLAGVGLAALAAGLTGWLAGRLAWVERLAALAGAFLFMAPGWGWRGSGLALALAGMAGLSRRICRR